MTLNHRSTGRFFLLQGIVALGTKNLQLVYQASYTLSMVRHASHVLNSATRMARLHTVFIFHGSF